MSVELVAVIPIVVFFALAIVQINQLFRISIDNLADSEAEASRRILEWEMESDGLTRPCIENIESTYYLNGISMPQGVKTVEGIICIHNQEI